MSDLNLTLQDNGGVYLAITETPAVVTLGQAVISGALASTVTVSNVVSVSVVTMPAITVQAAAPSVTTVAGSVSISNLPATQTIAGTVTASVYSGQYIKVTFTGEFNGTYYLERKSEYRYQSGAEGGFAFEGIYIDYNSDESRWEFVLGNEGLQATNNSGEFLPPKTGWTLIESLSSLEISYENPLARQVFGTVTANVTNSVTVGSLPVQLSTTTIGGTSRLNVTLSSATTVGATAPSYGNLSGGSDGTNFRAILTDTSGRTVVTGSVGISGTVPVSGTFYQATQPVSGTVTATIASTTVTVSAMPSGTLTTRFGTPTTANTAFLTSAVTNTARKYLLIQNVTTASNVITVGVGFVPTTTQGIQLAAGAGITFESSYIPTGAVWVLSSVTASNHTILEA